jgi:hypothetical protein
MLQTERLLWLGMMGIEAHMSFDCCRLCQLVMLVGLMGGWTVNDPRSLRADEVVNALLPYLPESANVVAIVRVEQLMNSPRGKSEGWANAQQERFLAGASSIPRQVNTLVLGMQVRPQTSELVSSIGLASIPQGVQLKAFVEREGDAPIDTLSGHPAVQSKYNAFYIELSKTVLAIVSPAARQEAARYVRHVTTVAHTQLPEGYLGTATQLNHQIIIAMDLQDLSNPDRIQQDLGQLDGVQGQPALQKELLELLTTVNGVRFCADVTDRTHATLAVDFAKQPSPSAVVLKAMILRIISDAGLHVSELDEATVAIEGKSLVLSMPNFSDASLRLVLSLISPSAPVPEAAGPDRPTDSASTRPQTTTPDLSSGEAAASLRYFRTVNQCLDDLQQANARNREPGQNATWHENIARKIEKLSTRGVDPQLVAYALATSERLKALAASLKGVAIEVNIIGKTIVWKTTYDPGYTEANVWGGYGYRAPSVKYDSNLQQVRERQAEAVLRGEKDRQQAWDIINDERKQMSHKVTARYGSK